MDKYLRWFIKYQVYMIVVFTLLMVILLTPAMTDHKTDEIANLRFGGTVAAIFGFSWTVAAVCLMMAIHNEDKRYIYPYLAVLGVDLTLLVLREFYLMIVHRFYIEIITVKIFIATITLPYVLASLFALHRLFTVDPIDSQRNEGFVRFDRNETSGIEENQHNTTSTPAPNGIQVV